MFVLSVVVLTVTIQVISSQDHGPPPNLPPQCRGPPPGVDRPMDCCKIPPFFREDDFLGCGFTKQEDEQRPKGPPHGPHDCSKQLCIMEKYNLSTVDGGIDKEKTKAFMDGYSEKNEIFKSAIDSAKEKCVVENIPGPPHICEANRLVFCISGTVFKECPVWEDTDSCKALKAHMEECEPYFKRH